MNKAPLLTPRLQEAMNMAIRVHGTMVRKGDGKPYLLHPMSVFGLLSAWHADEDTCIAGLLHDVIEDAENDAQRAAYREEIKKTFGENVLEIVEGVTEQDKSLPWKERKKLYLAHLREASKASLLVSCADKTHNVAALVEIYRKDGEKIWKRFNASKQWKVWFIDQTVAILKERLDAEYMTELCSHVQELNTLLSRFLEPEERSDFCEILDENGGRKIIIDPLYAELWDHCMLTEKEMESGVLEEDAAARAQEISGEKPAPSILHETPPEDSPAPAPPSKEELSDEASGSTSVILSGEGLPDDVIGYVEMLQSMANLCSSHGGEDELCTSLSNLTSSLDEKQLIRLALCLMDKLYCEIQFKGRTYDKAFYAYLDLLKRGIFDPLLEKKLPTAYLVDNTYIEPKKRMPMIAKCFRAAGFAVYSPEIVWLQNQALTAKDCIGLSYASFLDSLRHKHEHCMYFTSSHEDRSWLYNELLDAFAKNETHLCLFREGGYSSEQIKLFGALRKKYDLFPYTVSVDDNFHFKGKPDESERYTYGQYATWEEAEAACKKIVDHWLFDVHKPGMRGEDLYRGYVCGGEDPFIVSSQSDAKEKNFSAWDYAKQSCKEICEEDQPQDPL